jgi:hypothetical protein
LRLQLTRAVAFVAAATVAFAAAAGPARAEDHAGVNLTYFVEPGSAIGNCPTGVSSSVCNQTLHVFHPQADVAVDAGSHVTFSAGYDADVVSGATARTYKRNTGVDATSGATPFSDTRHAFHAGLEYRTGAVTLDGTYTYAFENDYRSHVVGAGARVDLLNHNTTFALSYAHNFDTVCDADNRGVTPLQRVALDNARQCFTQTPGILDEALAIDSYQGSWTQVLTRVWLMQVTLGVEVIDGFQSNPYRRVRLFDGAAEAQESEPLLRQRVAAQVRMRWAIPSWHAAVGATGRFYWDTWGVRSGTAEVELSQYLGEHFLLRLRGRYYQQSRAVFYRDAGEPLSYESVGPVGQYFTGDRELSPFRDYLVGAKLSYLRSADEHGRLGRLFTDVDVGVKLDVIKYDATTPQPPNLERSLGPVSALIVQAGVTARF